MANQDDAPLSREDALKALELEWKQNKETSPFRGRGGDLYEAAKNEFRSDRLRVAEMQDALNYLSSITSDPAFRNAAAALAAYGLGDGGLKSAVKRMVDKSALSHSAMLIEEMHELVLRGASHREAAEVVTAKWGIPGQSFRSASDTLRKRYGTWDRTPSPPIPLGDTGRKLKVQLRSPLREAMHDRAIDGIPFDENGIGKVPDNRVWRLHIQDGRVTFLKEVKPSA